MLRFRHTFIAKVTPAGVSDALMQQVVGYEMTSAGITDRYTHTFPIKDVLEVIDCLVYEESILVLLLCWWLFCRNNHIHKIYGSLVMHI